MEFKVKNQYETPVMQVYEVKPEGVICNISGNQEDYGNAWEI